MANNRVTFGGQTVMDITDTTAEASDVAAGEVFYDRGGVRQVGTGNYMNKAANPTADDILVTDANGQAVDSGVLIGDVALAADLPGQATDTTLGLVKLNPNESVDLNASGQLTVGGRLGQYPNGGIFYGTDREPRNVAPYSFLVTDSKGMEMNSQKAFALVSGVSVNLTKSHAAGSTQYTVQNTYLLCPIHKGSSKGEEVELV